MWNASVISRLNQTGKQHAVSAELSRQQVRAEKRGSRAAPTMAGLAVLQNAPLSSPAPFFLNSCEHMNRFLPPPSAVSDSVAHRSQPGQWDARSHAGVVLLRAPLPAPSQNIRCKSCRVQGCKSLPCCDSASPRAALWGPRGALRNLSVLDRKWLRTPIP